MLGLKRGMVALFLHEKESAGLGICKAIFGKDVLIETFPWPYVDTLVYALPISVLVLVVVSLLTPQLNAPHIRRCFKNR
jgi:SSS family solute:Na+ symporter